MLQLDTDTFDADFTDDADLDACWSLDDLDHSADLGSVRSACARSNDGNDA